MDHIIKMNNVEGVKIPRGHGGLRRLGEGSWAQRVARIWSWRGVMVF